MSSRSLIVLTQALRHDYHQDYTYEVEKHGRHREDWIGVEEELSDKLLAESLKDLE
ncbi:hypothetical protein PIB30_115223, partial [Stylosanthes scabra]|nr:hypothetical protein [Stylosanthes scabra]